METSSDDFLSIFCCYFLARHPSTAPFAIYKIYTHLYISQNYGPFSKIMASFHSGFHCEVLESLISNAIY